MNYGVLLGQRNTDWISGKIPFEERNPSGDWTAYLPKEEWQRNAHVDTMACVSFSALNSIETQYKFLTGEERNFSDRFTAYMSGTTTNGNYLFKVGDSIRHDGLVDESTWPAPDNFTWETYYTPPSVEAINEGKDFVNDWKVNYEFVDFTKESLMHHLKQSPIQVVIPGHAVLGFYTNDQIIKYFDTYSPFIKEVSTVSSALKYVLKPKGMTVEEIKHLYALAFYREPTTDEVDYWVDRPLSEFLKVAIGDRAEFLKNQLS